MNDKYSTVPTAAKYHLPPKVADLTMAISYDLLATYNIGKAFNMWKVGLT